MSATTVVYEGALRCSAKHEDSGAVVVTDAPKDNLGNGASSLRVSCCLSRWEAAF